MDAEPEPLDLTETIVAVALLMREAEGASDRTLENIFKQAARRGGRQTFHRGKLGRYKYYRDSNSFALVQPSDAEARADLRASDRSIERIIKKLVSYDRGRLEQIFLALPISREGQEQAVALGVGLAMGVFRLFPPGEWYDGPYRSVQFLTRETTGLLR